MLLAEWYIPSYSHGSNSRSIWLIMFPSMNLFFRPSISLYLKIHPKQHLHTYIYSIYISLSLSLCPSVRPSLSLKLSAAVPSGHPYIVPCNTALQANCLHSVKSPGYVPLMWSSIYLFLWYSQEFPVIFPWYSAINQPQNHHLGGWDWHHTPRFPHESRFHDGISLILFSNFFTYNRFAW